MYLNTNTKQYYTDIKDVERRMKVTKKEIDELINKEELRYFDNNKLGEYLANGIAVIDNKEYSTFNKKQPL